MSSRITQRHQRIKFFQAFLRLLAFYRLRFINDNYRIGPGNNIDRPATAKLVQLHINTACILTLDIKCLRVDDHYIYRAVRSKAVDLCQPVRVINKKTNLLTVFLRKMFLCHLKGFINTFANSNTRYDHNIFTPAITLVQLVHGFDVSVCFTDTSLHLYSQIVSALQLIRWFYLVISLYFIDIFQYDAIIQFRHDTLIVPACILYQRTLPLLMPFIDQISRGQIRLAGKHITYCFCRIGLELLMFKL